MGRELGKLERQLFAYAQLRRLQTLKLGDLREPLRLSAKQECALYGRLARAGMIAKVKRGVYLVPAQLPLGRKWSPDEAQVLQALVVDEGGRYQVSGPNAFNRYGFDEQVPARIYAYNNRLSGERKVGAVALTLIKVADERLGDTEEVEAASGAKLVYSSRARTLVDAIYDWSRFAGLPRAYRWIRAELSTKRIGVGGLVRVALRYGNQGTLRRLGALLEDIGVRGKWLAELEGGLRSSKSLILMAPGLRGVGKINKRWGVVLNEPT